MIVVTIDNGSRTEFVKMADNEYYDLDESLVEGEVNGYPIDDLDVCTAQEFIKRFGKITLDRVGREIQVGNTVLFPVRHSSSCWLEQGKVVALNRNGRDVVTIKSSKTNCNNYRNARDVVVVP